MVGLPARARRATASMEKPAMPSSLRMASAASRMASWLAGLRRAPIERRAALSSVAVVFMVSIWVKNAAQKRLERNGSFQYITERTVSLEVFMSLSARARMAFLMTFAVYPVVVVYATIIGMLTPGWEFWQRSLILVPFM